MGEGRHAGNAGKVGGAGPEASKPDPKQPPKEADLHKHHALLAGYHGLEKHSAKLAYKGHKTAGTLDTDEGKAATDRYKEQTVLHAYHKARASQTLPEGQQAHDVKQDKLSHVGAYGKAHAASSTPQAEALADEAAKKK